MKLYNGEPYVVSITSFGKRLDSIGLAIFTLFKQEYKNFHIMLTISNSSVECISYELKLMLLENLVELNVIDDDKDLGPHTKYYYAMQKYGNLPIMTFDDDRCYAPWMVGNLVNKYESLKYKSVISNCAIEMQRTKTGDLLPYPDWCAHRLAPGKRSFIAMAEGFAGVLYPPNCFADLSTQLTEMMKCKFDDDLWLKVLEIRQNIPVTQSDYVFRSKDAIDIEDAMQYNLHENQNAGNVNRVNMCRLFSQDLLKGFDHV